MPEFLTERNWRDDFYRCGLWVLGSSNQKSAELLQKLLTTAKEQGKILYDTLSVCGTTEAELIKYGRNTFLAAKVSFFNEIESLSSALKCDYSKVAQLLTADPRIGSSHSIGTSPCFTRC